MRVGWERPPRRESTKTRLLEEIKVREQQAASSPAAERALRDPTNTSTAVDCGCVNGGGSIQRANGASGVGANQPGRNIKRS